jgi:peptidoglycan/LPS O-acetylase OafA/YrhL
VTAATASASFLRSAIAQTGGRVSYSMFLWNYPLLMFLSLHGLLVAGSGPVPFLANLVVASVVVGAASLITYRCVELPCLRLRSPARPAAVPVLISAG